jgi:hypothetical protein
MSSFRVYEIAGQLNISSEEVIRMGNDLGLNLKSHSSVLSQPQVEEIAEVYNKTKAGSQTDQSAATNSSVNEPGQPGANGDNGRESGSISGGKSQKSDAPKVVSQFKPIPKRGIISSSVQWKPVPKRGETVKEALDKVILMGEELRLLSPDGPAVPTTTLGQKVLKTSLAKVKIIKKIDLSSCRNVLVQQMIQGLLSLDWIFKIEGFKLHSKSFFDVGAHLSRFVPDNEGWESK